MKPETSPELAAAIAFLSGSDDVVLRNVYGQFIECTLPEFISHLRRIEDEVVGQQKKMRGAVGWPLSCSGICFACATWVTYSLFKSPPAPDWLALLSCVGIAANLFFGVKILWQVWDVFRDLRDLRRELRAKLEWAQSLYAAHGATKPEGLMQ